MLSTFIRLGAALSCAAMLSSCGGNSVAETQQSTPEGIYTGDYKVTFAGPNTIDSSNTNVPALCKENVITFAVATGSIYTFYPSTANPAVLNAADYGALTFAGDAMNSSMLEVIAPASVPFVPAQGQTSADNPYASIAGQYSTLCNYFGNGVASATMVGGYQTGINLTETLNFGGADSNGWTVSRTTDTPPLLYDADYQGVQNLSTLAGTYNGYVSTSKSSEQATFTISPPSVPANAGNSLGVSVLTGTGASGCAYSGSVSPLYKGNGYTLSISTGDYPCLLPQAQFVGLIYLNTKTNILYSFAPSQGDTDGVIFSGTRG